MTLLLSHLVLTLLVTLFFESSGSKVGDSVLSYPVLQLSTLLLGHLVLQLVNLLFES